MRHITCQACIMRVPSCRQQEYQMICVDTGPCAVTHASGKLAIDSSTPNSAKPAGNCQSLVSLDVRKTSIPATGTQWTIATYQLSHARMIDCRFVWPVRPVHFSGAAVGSSQRLCHFRDLQAMCARELTIPLYGCPRGSKHLSCNHDEAGIVNTPAVAGR